MTKTATPPPEYSTMTLRQLDIEALVTVLGFPRKKIFIPNWDNDPHSTQWYYIASGKPAKTHMIDAHPVPYFADRDGDCGELVRYALKTRPDILGTFCEYLAIEVGLTQVANCHERFYISDVAPLLLATPAQRVRALLRAWEEAN